MYNIWKGYKEASQEKRAKNRENSADLLTKKEIPFIEHNGGAHLVVNHKGKFIDFWPGTGKYIVRGSKTKGRGIFNMLKYLDSK